jgi:hypothetical protein
MQYGVIPTSFAERLALLSGVVPLPIIDLSFGVLKARMIMAGVRLGVFQGLAQEPLTHERLAAALGLDSACLDLLLRCLVFAGYLELRGEHYALSTLARNTMIAGAKRELTGFAQWHYTQWEFIEQLEQLIRTGEGVDFHATMTDPDAWGHYQKAMLEMARFDAPILARRVPVRKGATRLLDVAGSHGLMGAAIARKHPPMRSTVVDLPAAIQHAHRFPGFPVQHHVVELGVVVRDPFLNIPTFPRPGKHIHNPFVLQRKGDLRLSPLTPAVPILPNRRLQSLKTLPRVVKIRNRFH